MIDLVKEEFRRPLEEVLKDAMRDAVKTRSAIKISTSSERRVLYAVAKRENMKVRIQKQNGGWLAFMLNN